MRFFFPEMDCQVDQVPLGQKAYLFFSPTYFRERWHVNLTAKKKKETIKALKTARIPFKVINYEKYCLIIPKNKPKKQLFLP